MAKLDRLGWADGIAFRAYGARVGVRVTDPSVLGQVAERLPLGWRRSRSATVDQLFSYVVGGADRRGLKRLHVVYSDADIIARSADMEEVLQRLESALQLHVAENSRHRIFVHAGVVGWRGRAIVIPGTSQSGKSTLVASLVRAGARYYSDEFALFDERGRVHPYPQPLAIGERGADARLRRRVRPESLGGRVGKRPLPLGLVLATRFEERGRFRPRRLSPGQGVLELLAHAVSARRAPGDVVETLARATPPGIVLKGVRGEADPVARRLLSGLARGDWGSVPEARR